jgi:hypothetical protein
MEYAPEKTLVDNAIMVIHPVFTSQTYSNDCLTKGVNFLVGDAYFTHQSQVLRMSVRFLKKNLETVKDIKIEQGVKINTFFEEFLVKDNKAYKLEKIMLPVTPFSYAKAYLGNDSCNFIRSFVKTNMLPLKDNKYNRLLVTATGTKGGIYSHAGAFVRRVIPAKNKDKKKVEVYYYDSNQNILYSLVVRVLVPSPWTGTFSESMRSSRCILSPAEYSRVTLRRTSMLLL